MDLAALIQWIIPIAGIAAVLFAGYLARDVLQPGHRNRRDARRGEHDP